MPIVLVVANSNNLSNLKELIAAKAAPTTLRISFEFWLGWQDYGGRPAHHPFGAGSATLAVQIRSRRICRTDGSHPA